MSDTLCVCPKCSSMNKVNAKSALEKKPVCGKCGAELPIHGLVVEAKTDDVKRILAKSEVPVVIDFWASWCGPCRMYGPEFEKASRTNQRAIFLKVNTESEQELSIELGIRGIPCTILFQNGKEIRRQSGAMSAEQVNQFIA